MENRKSYSYECPRCGNISVDYTSGDHMVSPQSSSVI